MTKSKVSFTLTVPKGFKNVQQCHFSIQAGARPVQNLITLNIRDIQWLKSGDGAGMWLGSQNGVVLMYDETSDVLLFAMRQSNDISRYILESFQHYIWPGETNIRTIAMGEGKLRIVPFMFCSSIAASLDTVVRVMYEDDRERIRFNPIYGFELLGNSWGVGPILRLPIISLQRQVMIGIMRQLQNLESIPMRERTVANWTEMERLTKIIRQSADTVVIECVLCSNEAIGRAKHSGIPYCSQMCAKIDSRLKKN